MSNIVERMRFKKENSFEPKEIKDFDPHLSPE